MKNLVLPSTREKMGYILCKDLVHIACTTKSQILYCIFVTFLFTYMIVHYLHIICTISLYKICTCLVQSLHKLCIGFCIKYVSVLYVIHAYYLVFLYVICDRFVNVSFIYLHSNYTIVSTIKDTVMVSDIQSE